MLCFQSRCILMNATGQAVELKTQSSVENENLRQKVEKLANEIHEKDAAIARLQARYDHGHVCCCSHTLCFLRGDESAAHQSEKASSPSRSIAAATQPWK